MSATDSIFTQVTLRADRERVYSRLVSGRAQFSFQINHQLFTGRITDRQNGMLLFEMADKLIGAEPVPATISFSLPPEMFFMHTKLTRRKSGFAIDLNSDLYKLQRRDSFRLHIPLSYKARFELRTLDLVSLRVVLPVMDMSGGGLNFEMVGANEKIQAGMHASGVIQVGNEFKKEVTGEIKHVRPFGSMGSGVYRVGLQFEGLRPKEQEEIIALVLRIHRETFAKFKTG